MLLKLVFVTSFIFLMLTNYVYCGEIDMQFDGLRTDMENSRPVSQKVLGPASKKVLGKDSSLVPIPIPISNPTIGTGMAAGLIYLHPQDSEKQDAPTTTSGVMGLYTNTNSWGVGAFHDGYYLDDRIRFRVPLGHGEFNLDFYGIGSDSPIKDNPVEFKAVANVIMPRLVFELPWDNWFLGLEYRLLDIDTQFDLSNIFPRLPGINIRNQTAGLGLVAVYDSRDSNLWPSKGNWLELTGTQHGEYAGGDYNYFKLVAHWAQYFPFTDTVTWVYRLDGQYVDEKAPFWDLPRVRLRGYAGGQLMDDLALTAQTEIRWNFYKNWIALAFVGGGRIAETFGDIGSATTSWAGGSGLKYMLVEEQKLTVGIDLTYAEGGAVSVYFQVGDWLAN